MILGMTSKNLRIQTQKNRKYQRGSLFRMTLCNESLKTCFIIWILPVVQLSCINKNTQNQNKLKNSQKQIKNQTNNRKTKNQKT